jgi:hypothetical protein
MFWLKRNTNYLKRGEKESGAWVSADLLHLIDPALGHLVVVCVFIPGAHVQDEEPLPRSHG